jgi:flagellar export protein FliJ
LKRFRFSLERILGFRERQESQARLLLSGVLARIAQEEDRIRKLEAEYRTRRRDLDERLESRAPGASLLQALAHLQGVETRIEEARQRLVELERERSKSQEAYREARRARRVLERLRERRQDQHRRQTAREELARFDEIAGLRSFEARKETEEAGGPADREARAT